MLALLLQPDVSSRSLLHLAPCFPSAGLAAGRSEDHPKDVKTPRNTKILRLFLFWASFVSWRLNGSPSHPNPGSVFSDRSEEFASADVDRIVGPRKVKTPTRRLTS